MEKKDPLETILKRNPDLDIPNPPTVGLDMFVMIGRAVYPISEELYFSSSIVLPFDWGGFNYGGRWDVSRSPYNIYTLWNSFPIAKEEGIILETIDNSRRNKENILRKILGIGGGGDKLPSPVTIREEDIGEREVYRLK